MIKTVSMSADDEGKLTLKLNDWLKGWPDEKILGIDFIYRPELIRGKYLAFVVYQV